MGVLVEHEWSIRIGIITIYFFLGGMNGKQFNSYTYKSSIRLLTDAVQCLIVNDDGG